MIRWSCQRLQGCVPVAPSARPRPLVSSASWARRVPISSAASAKLGQRPVRTSTSEAISSPTRCSSTAEPAAAAFTSSKRLTSESVSGSRSANSSSTARVRSVPLSKAARASSSSTWYGTFCASPIEAPSLFDGLEQAFCDAGPRPALHCDAPGGLAERLAARRREPQQVVELARQVDRVAGLEAREAAEVGRIGLLQPGGDLLEPGVPGDDRRTARGGGLGGDHPERLGEDRRHDDGVGEGDQVDEVAMPERPGEQRPRRRDALELASVVPEADDDGPRVDSVQRLEQHVDALVVEQLPEVEDDRPVASQELREAPLVALVRQALLAVTRVRRVGAAL